MKAGILLTIGILIISCGIAGSIILKNSQKKVTQTSPKNTLSASSRTYKSSDYGFQFSYPNTVTLSENEGYIVITPKRKDLQPIIAQVVSSPVSLSFTERVNQALASFCGDGKILRYCPIDSQAVITSTFGATGNSYYLSTTNQTSAKNEVILGPILIFPLALDDTTKSALLLFYTQDLSAGDAEKKVLTSIVDTLTLPSISPQPTPISSLSGLLLPLSLTGSASAK